MLLRYIKIQRCKEEKIHRIIDIEGNSFLILMEEKVKLRTKVVTKITELKKERSEVYQDIERNVVESKNIPNFSRVLTKQFLRNSSYTSRQQNKN